jgi:RimJ/RimL family protein N-acetyltransferase
MNPILLDFPDSFESERLLIRCPRPGDGQAMHEAIVESLDELRPWMPWARGEQSRDVSEAYCRECIAEFASRKSLQLILLDKRDGSFVGGSGFHDIDWVVPKFEIGYWLRSSRTHQGFMTETVNALAQFAFGALKARRVQIRMDNRNERSWRVAERCDFRLEGVLRNFELGLDGAPRDTRLYAKTQ